MHFFYLDESGCTGNDLTSVEQPIFVLGGISVKDQGWRLTTDGFNSILRDFFGGTTPAGFELHASQLISGEGPFANYEREQRNALAYALLDLITERRHPIHFLAIDKSALANALPGEGHAAFDCSSPYLLAFNYLVGYIEKYTKTQLGQTARSMIILDQKELYQHEVDAITHYRRYSVAQARRLKWLVEFSYPVDSARHPMIQLTDLVIFLARKFLEVENGYRADWQDPAKTFFATCYGKIIRRVKWNSLINTPGQEEVGARSLLAAAHSTHRRQWKSHYQLQAI